MVDKMQAAAYINHQLRDVHVLDDNMHDIVVGSNDMLDAQESFAQCYLHSQEYQLPSEIADDCTIIRESDCANRLTVGPYMDWT